MFMLNIFLVFFSLFQANDCPVDMRVIAKCEISYVGDNGLCVFEKGEDLIYLSTLGYTDGEISYLTYYIAPDRGTEVSAVYVKAGNDSSNLYLYSPYELAENPPKELYIEAGGNQGISHATWCSPNRPTAVALSDVSATAKDSIPGWVGFIVGAATVVGLVVLYLTVRRNAPADVERSGLPKK